MTTSFPDRAETVTSDDLIASVRRELEQARSMGSIDPVPDEDLARVASDSVRLLWDQSRVKTFLPVLATRSARDQLREAARSHPLTPPQPARESLSITGLAEELESRLEVQLTYTPSERWNARLTVHLDEDEIPMTVRVTANGESPDEALEGAIIKARDILLT